MPDAERAVHPAQYVRVPLKECLPTAASPEKNAPKEQDFGALPDLIKSIARPTNTDRSMF